MGEWEDKIIEQLTAKVEALIRRINNKLNKLIHLNCHHHFEQLSAIRRPTTMSTLTKNLSHYPTLRKGQYSWLPGKVTFNYAAKAGARLRAKY